MYGLGSFVIGDTSLIGTILTDRDRSIGFVLEGCKPNYRTLKKS